MHIWSIYVDKGGEIAIDHCYEEYESPRGVCDDILKLKLDRVLYCDKNTFSFGVRICMEVV